MKAKEKIVVKEKEEDIVIIEDRVERDTRVDKSMSPTTTVEEDKTIQGQRDINQLWERTQAIIAVLVVISNMIVGTAQGIGVVETVEFPFILSSSLFLVIGFYFSRTNHQAIGGLGYKANQEQIYKGR